MAGVNPFLALMAPGGAGPSQPSAPAAPAAPSAAPAPSGLAGIDPSILALISQAITAPLEVQQAQSLQRRGEELQDPRFGGPGQTQAQLHGGAAIPWAMAQMLNAYTGGQQLSQYSKAMADILATYRKIPKQLAGGGGGEGPPMPGGP